MPAPYSLSSLLRSKAYETQVILIVGWLATLRLIIALVFDIASQTNWAEVVIDVVLFAFFAGLLVATQHANFKKVHAAYGVLIIALLSVNFLQFGGVDGLSRFNYLNGIFVIILLYQSRTLFWLLALQFLFLVIMTAATVAHHEWINIFLVNPSQNYSDFIFSLLAAGLLAFYLKHITEQEIDRFQILTDQLRHNVNQLRVVNKQLAIKGTELKDAQASLEREVHNRTLSLQRQQAAIEEYISINRDDLPALMQRLDTAMSCMQYDDDIYSQILRDSHAELRTVFSQIKSKLETNGELNRHTIRP